MPATSNAAIEASAAAICLATVNISGIAITNDSEVSLTSVITSLVTEGRIILNT